MLQIELLNRDGEPTCRSTQLVTRGVSSWALHVQGATGGSAPFDRAGNTRRCGLAPREPITLSICTAQGQHIAVDGSGQARGGDILRGVVR